MELFSLCGLTLLALLFSTFLVFLFHNRSSYASHPNLPPGRLGFPIIGESPEFLSTGKKGIPEKFVFDRIAKYSSNVFKTSIVGVPTIVASGQAGNKLLFSNENKAVNVWRPLHLNKIFPSTTSVNDDAKIVRNMFTHFLKLEALKEYIGTMDTIAQRHLDTFWEGKQEVCVLPLAKIHTFSVACKVFLSLEDPEEVAKLAKPFDLVADGIVSIPINLPGTAFYRGVKASDQIRKAVLAIIKQRKIDLAENKASPKQDILSGMLSTGDDLNEGDMATWILGLLIGGHDTASSTITFTLKYLAENPQCYDEVYKEQMEIANSKQPGELLNWIDMQKMKYSWNCACEALRLAPPLLGCFREAISDINFEGYTIPKGWKLYWSSISSHLNPKYFPDPKKFDPTRFQGNGPLPYTFIPFGGGPRRCPGNEYARLEILSFMHNLVKRFKWERTVEDEKIMMVPLPIPAKGLPVRLIPH